MQNVQDSVKLPKKLEIQKQFMGNQQIQKKLIIISETNVFVNLIVLFDNEGTLP